MDILASVAAVMVSRSQAETQSLPAGQMDRTQFRRLEEFPGIAFSHTGEAVRLSDRMRLPLKQSASGWWYYDCRDLLSDPTAKGKRKAAYLFCTAWHGPGGHGRGRYAYCIDENATNLAADNLKWSSKNNKMQKLPVVRHDFPNRIFPTLLQEATTRA
jgi:hypothetical protein